MAQSRACPLQPLLAGHRERRLARGAALAFLGLRLLAAACQGGSHGLAADAALVGVSTLASRARSTSWRVARPAQHVSKFHGVSWHETREKWQAHVPDPATQNPVSLGVFGSELDAARTFDRTVLALKQDAATNFPADTYSEAEVESEALQLKDFWRQRPSSRYTGVYKTRGNSKWKAEIELYDVKQFIDYFSEEVEAAHAVDNAIRSTGVEKALQLKMLNFRRPGDFFEEDTWEQEATPRGASSCFLGVVYHQPSGQYLAKLGRRHIGLFDTEVEAAHAFDEASHAAAGPTNFQPPSDER